MDGYIIVIYFTIYENDFVLFLLIGMFKWQHFSMDAIQNGYFFSQKWCTVELYHLEDRRK